MKRVSYLILAMSLGAASLCAEDSQVQCLSKQHALANPKGSTGTIEEATEPSMAQPSNPEDPLLRPPPEERAPNAAKRGAPSKQVLEAADPTMAPESVGKPGAAPQGTGKKLVPEPAPVYTEER